MGRKLKNRRESSAKTVAIFRPAAAGWEKWSQDEEGAWASRENGPELEDLAPSAGSLIAVPVRRAFSLAVWVPSDDPAIFHDLVLTQLEMRGLAGRQREDTVLSWREIAREDGEALLQVVVLPVHLAPRYWHGEVTDYAVSPDCLPLSPDSITIWREEGAWVAAVTRGDKLLHFQSLNEPLPDESMVLEISMMLAPLEAGNMVAVRPAVTFYRSPGEELDLSAWAGADWAPVSALDFPPPVLPTRMLDRAPLPVRELQDRKARSAQRQRFAFAAAAVYLVLVLLLAGQTLWLHHKARNLQAEIERDTPAVAATREAMDRWQAIQPAVEPATYPLEVLYQIASLLPKDGIRLTLFEMNLERVRIEGEASTLPMANTYQDELKKNTATGDFYEWSAEQTKQLPNGSTRFQINGVRRGSIVQKDNESADI